MPVGGHVHRHAVHRRIEIGAVIQIETAQEVLIGLAAARMLGGDQPGHRFHYLPGSQNRTGAQFVTVHPAFRGRHRRRLLLGLAGHVNRLQLMGAHWRRHRPEQPHDGGACPDPLNTHPLDPCLFLTFLGLGYRRRDEDGANLAEYIQTLLGYWSLVKL